MNITIPELSLVVLIGPSGSGKSTFARQHFQPTEILSSDFCRGLVSDDQNDQRATNDAFDVLHFIAAKRLAAGKLTVVDATNVQKEARAPLVALARQYHCLPVAVVLDLPVRLCHERNRTRPDRGFGSHVVRQQHQALRASFRGLRYEGFRHVYAIRSPEEAEAVTVARQPLWCDRRDEKGPFDIIGDVHGCFEELTALLETLDYAIAWDDADPALPVSAAHPGGRRAVFLGDLVDRGPGICEVLRLVMGMVASGSALCVPGNHEIKLMRKLRGKDVRITHGLAESLEQIERQPDGFAAQVADFIDDLVSHYVLDGGRLVVAHAGMKESMQGRGSGAVREFAMYGETTGETDEFGLPVRYDWAADYRGPAAVVYGHTPVPEPEWLNGTINIDTGCVFGGNLTALRWPERETVAVPAARVYFEPAKPFPAQAARDAGIPAQQAHDDLLDVGDVLGKRIISTRLNRTVTVRAENAIAALEVMSRFAANPKWLIYLPPTMSPTETSREPGFLEHPAQAFAYYRHEGVPRVICERKHMGSRMVLVVCRDAAAARRRFGVTGGEAGIAYTRTGRRFFDDARVEAEVLSRVRAAIDASGLWEELETEWVCIDAELMPWSAKAHHLVRAQYAAVGAASRAALAEEARVLTAARDAGVDVGELLGRVTDRLDLVRRYADAYRGYCWTVASVADLRVAPFHLLASEKKVHSDKDHLWHMKTLARLCREEEPLIVPTEHHIVDVTDEQVQRDAVSWWESLTESGGEGMVVKPLDFVVKGRRGLVQPAVKCRGREYLRIIYGPEYTLPETLDRLRGRGLSVKRSLAIREFALGLEALERFVSGEPLRRVHECVFGVLALESQPVDPRL